MSAEQVSWEDSIPGLTPPTLARRGTTNRNARGSAEDRRRRRAYLVETYRADVVLVLDDFDNAPQPMTPHLASLYYKHHQIQQCCRCYRCGKLLTVDTVTVDRIVPGCKGGTYRRTNIRPACSGCNSETGGALAGKGKR
jgi:5-methylcytosine-specific restriction endonuclease McrA